MLHFFKKIKRNTCRYDYQNLNDIISSSWDIQQNIRKLVILGHFLPFYHPKTPKNQNFEKWTICWSYHHSTHVYQKSQSCTVPDIWTRPGEFFVILGHFLPFLKHKVQQTEIFVILGHSLSFQLPENLENQNLKIEKNTWRYYHSTHLHHKWQSYDVWFLRYGAQQTEFFVILDRFCPFTTLWT